MTNINENNENNKNNNGGWREWLIHLPRRPKRALLILNDLFLLSFALWASLSLRLSTLYVPPNLKFALLLSLAPVISVATFHYFGLYRLVTRYIGHRGTVKIYAAVAVSVMIWALIVLMSGITGVPRSVVIMYGFLATFFIWISRQLAGWILKSIPYATPASFDDPEKSNVVIYGAGTTGVQLLQALRQSGTYQPIGFVDDDPSLWRQNIHGLKVYRPEKISRLIERDMVREIFLAIPGAPRHRRRAVINNLQPHSVAIKTLPAIADIATGRVQVSDLRPIDVDDLLGRDPVPPDEQLLMKNIRGKSVLITGAGGSIGSELSRQVLNLAPRKLVLFELSEAALYEIDIKLTQQRQRLIDEARKLGKTAPDIELVAVLGSVLDKELVLNTIAKHSIETIYHAAAYKHVPIVEANPIAGLKNNTFGTHVIAKVAKTLNVEQFVLVSTDKAVRPTNIMGASKRLAELILQAQAEDPDTQTVFTMVRFGNVLDSSGSVVRRFRKQIRDGGPVTVTHPEIIRYFMSIPEAAELVIQSGAMAEGGDVFVLDMGSPVKIADLARSMIRLMGLDVMDEENPNGDIAIEYVGLRQGEKLYEELLIGENTTGTAHPRIMKNLEPHLSLAALNKEFRELENAMESHDIDEIHAILMRTVEGYAPETGHLPAQDSDLEDWQLLPRTLH